MTDPEFLANRKRWRSWAGNYLMYDTMGAAQLGLLTLFFGLRERHKLLEIGSGSLRAARFLIPYLDTGHYCGVEPNAWAVQMGIENELGEEMAARKKPRFSTREDCVFDEFGETFDYAVSYSVLTHIPPPQIQMMFDGLGRVVHDHSICLLSALTSEDERIVDPEKWTTLPCNLYSEGRLAAAAERAGLRLVRGGRVFQDWLVAFQGDNEIALRGAAQMRNVDWPEVTPKWEDPGWAAKGERVR